MAAYRQAVDARLRQVVDNQQHVDAADHFMESYATRGGFMGIYLTVVGVPVAMAGVYIALQSTQLVPTSALFPAAFMATVAAITLIGTRTVFGVKASDTETLKMGDVPVACPECGAPGSLSVGAAVSSCSFCDTQLVATAVAVERGIDAAEGVRRQSLLQRLRKEREVMLHVNRPPKVMKVLVPAWGVALIGGIVYMAFLESTVQGLAALGGAALIIAVVATFMVRSQRRDRERLHAYRDVAQQLRSRVGYGVEALVAWLNRYWSSSYPPQHLYTHAHLIEANTGFPTMIALKPDRAEAFIAANMEGTTGSAEASQEQKWLRYLGFVVKITDAGAWLEASPELLKRLGQDVAAHRLLSPAVVHGARMVRNMGARAIS